MSREMRYGAQMVISKCHSFHSASIVLRSATWSESASVEKWQKCLFSCAASFGQRSSHIWPMLMQHAILSTWPTCSWCAQFAVVAQSHRWRLQWFYLCNEVFALFGRSIGNVCADHFHLNFKWDFYFRVFDAHVWMLIRPSLCRMYICESEHGKFEIDWLIDRNRTN